MGISAQFAYHNIFYFHCYNSHPVGGYGAEMTLMDAGHNTCPGQMVHHAAMDFGVNVASVF